MGSAYWRFCPDAQRLLRYSFSPDFPRPLFFSFSFSPFKVPKRSSSSPLCRRRKAHVLCLEIWTRALPSREGAVVWDGTGFSGSLGAAGLPGRRLPSNSWRSITPAQARPLGITFFSGRQGLPTCFPRAQRSAGPVKPVDPKCAAFRVFPG